MGPNRKVEKKTCFRFIHVNNSKPGLNFLFYGIPENWNDEIREI